MSTQPVDAASDRLLTVAEYLEIGEVEPGYTELVEGRLLLSPSPTCRHSRACGKLWSALDAQLPPELDRAWTSTSTSSSAGRRPGNGAPTGRRGRRHAAVRIDQEGGVLRASDVVLAVEILSPGSRRIDRVLKRDEYADAGIPHYWIVDLDEPVSLLACHLAGEFGYVDGGAVTGVFRTTEPFPVEIDLDALV